MFNGKSFKKAWGKGGSGFAKDVWGKGGENFFGAMTGTSQTVAAAEERAAQARAEEQAAQQRANEARAQQEAAQQRAIADKATADAEKAKLQAEAAELQAMLDIAKAQAAADQEAKKVAELKAQLAQFNISPKSDAAASSPPSYEDIESVNASALEAGIKASQDNQAAALPSIKEVDENLELGKALSLSEILQQQFKTLVSNILNLKTLPDNVHLTQNQFNSFKEYCLKEFPFQGSKADGNNEGKLQGHAQHWLDIMEPHIVANDADSDLPLVTCMGSD